MFTRRQTLVGGVSAAVTAPLMAGADSPDNDVVIIPIRLTSDRLWTFVTLGEDEQLIAIFDSGAFLDMISENLANRLKLKMMQSFAYEGLGGRGEGNYVRTEQLTIGGAYTPKSWGFLTTKTLDKQLFKLLFSSHSLVYFDSEFDLNRAQWRIHKKGTLDFSGYSKVHDSYKNVSLAPGWWGTELQLDCTVAGFSGSFHFDTGSPTNFLLDGQATAKLGLWDSAQPFAPWRTGGFGPGRINTRLYRLPTATVHGMSLDKPLVMLSDPARSTSQVSGYAGLVGLKAIRHFNFLFDSKGKALWMKPNGIEFDDKDGRYPMSGLWLEQKRDAIIVDEVGIGSPAAGAGIVAGDQIVGSDWQSLIARINGDAGEQFSLQIERSGKRFSADLTLQPYL